MTAYSLVVLQLKKKKNAMKLRAAKLLKRIQMLMQDLWSAQSSFFLSEIFAQLILFH